MSYSVPHCVEIIHSAIRCDEFISKFLIASVQFSRLPCLPFSSYRLHNFIITRNLNDATFRHEFPSNTKEHVVLAEPSAIDGDPLGEALIDPSFETEPVEDGDIPDLESSEIGISRRRQGLLTLCATLQLERPATSRRPRASDSQFALWLFVFVSM
jgi:hypothetical protein